MKYDYDVETVLLQDFFIFSTPTYQQGKMAHLIINTQFKQLLGH